MSLEAASNAEKGIVSHASAIDETNYVSDTTVMRVVRAVVAMGTVMLAAAALGCEANALHTYYTTNKYDVYWLSVWPSTLDISPSVGLIASSAIMIVLNLVFVIASVIPYPRPYLKAFDIATAALGISGMITTVTAVAYAYAVTTSGDSIKSWTCTWQPAVDTSTGERIEAVYPFERLCRQSEASFGINLTLAVVSFFIVVSAAIGRRMAQKIEMKRSGEYVEKDICGEVTWGPSE